MRTTDLLKRLILDLSHDLGKHGRKRAIRFAFRNAALLGKADAAFRANESEVVGSPAWKGIRLITNGLMRELAVSGIVSQRIDNAVRCVYRLAYDKAAARKQPLRKAAPPPIAVATAISLLDAIEEEGEEDVTGGARKGMVKAIKATARAHGRDGLASDVFRERERRWRGE